MAAAKAKAIEKDVDGLISSITGLSESQEEDQENFELCRRYVLSNIYFHRYLDTSSHEVRRQLRGLATKFRVHALPGRAQRLETLWSRLVEREDWAEHAQWDIEWRLLSLLVNLSHNPTSVASQPRRPAGQEPLEPLAEAGAGQEQEQEQEVDWSKELSLPGEEYSPYQSPEEWSDLDDDEDINISPPPVHVVRFSRPSLLLPGVEVGRSGAARPLPLAEQPDPLSWLEERISRPYQPVDLGPGPLRPCPDAAETYHSLQIRLGLSGPADVCVLAEWSVCRELVWQLLSPADSPLLQRRDGQFRPTGRFRVHGLTQAALSSQLSRLCAPVSAVSRLRGFVRSPGPLSTHRAFAAALRAHLRGLDSELLSLEAELQKQEVTLTLRGLQRRLAGWTSHLAELDRLLQRGVFSVAQDRPGWVHTARLVSVLYEAVELCADQRWSAALVGLFLNTLQPLLAVIDGWTLLETDPDPGREFLVQRNDETAVTDAQYWDSGFTVHSDPRGWWADGVEPLPFLLPHLHLVVQTAKCLRILYHLWLTEDLDDSSLQEEFNRLVSESLSRADECPPGLGTSPADTPPEPEGTCAGLPKKPEATPTDGTPADPPPKPAGASLEGASVDPTRESEAPKDAPKKSQDTAANPAVQPENSTPEAASSGVPQPSEGTTVKPPDGSEGSQTAATATLKKTEDVPKDSPEELEATAPKSDPADPPEPADAPEDPPRNPEDPPRNPEDPPRNPEDPPRGPEGTPSGRSAEGDGCPPPGDPSAPSGGMLQELLASYGSPYLSVAFEEVLQAVDAGRDESDGETERAAPAARLTTCVPHAVCAALGGPLAARQAAVCRRMVAALRSDFRLGEHLRMLRRVFLMEAGDLMAQFTQQLWSTLASDSDSDESVSLTLCLEDCISARYPEQAARFSVTLHPPAGGRPSPLERLEAVSLGYSVPWPCTIVITERCVERYNAMFRFILQLKFALRGLQTLRFKDLAQTGGDAELSGSPADSEQATPRASRVLRLQLLRAWLLHFVGNVHSYIMMRVLHSTLLELEESLEKATDVDSMVQTHELYLSVLLRRCLLSGPAERTLHAAVLSALRLAGRLRQLWTADELPSELELRRLEADYVRCHHFTAGLLRQYRQTMGHVDSLAAALAHSAPGQVTYDELV